MTGGSASIVLVDRYVLRQVLRPMFASLLIALIVLLIERLLRLLDLVLGSSGPLRVVVDIMAYLVPHYLGLALPLSLMLGVLIGFSALSRESELDGLQSAGIGLMRVARPVLLVGLVMTLLSAGVHGYLKPHARYAYQALVFSLNNAAVRALVRAGIFTDVGEKTFFIEGLGAGAAGNGVGRIFVYDASGDGGTQVITATSGTIGLAPQGMAAILRLRDGIRLTLPATPAASPESVSSPGILRFEELRTNLTDASDMMFRPRGQDERELTLPELSGALDRPPEGVRRSDVVAELHVRLIRIVSVPLIPLLAIPLAIGRRRSDRLHGIILCLMILLVYNNVVEFGKNMVQSGSAGPESGLWLPLLVFVAASTWMFWRTARRVPDTASSDPLSPLAGLLRPLERLLSRRVEERR